MRRIILCLLGAVIAHASVVFAQDGEIASANDSSLASSPAQVTVIVADRSDAALKQGLRTAFSQVMVQLSSDPGVMMKPDVKKAEANLTQLVDSYSYDESQNNGAEPKLLLQVNFDHAALEQLVSHASPVIKTVQQNTPEVSLLISVGNVQSVSDYAKVVQVMKESSAVESVAVKDVDPSHLLLEVKVAGSTVQFKQALSAKHELKPLLSEFQQSGLAADLYFDWMGA